MLRFLTVAACASLCGGSCEWSYEPGKCEAEISSESAFCGAENASAFVRSAAESLAGRVYVYSNPRLDAALGAIASLDAADGEAEAELHEHQAELLLHQLLIKSPLATSDYARARLFFVPVYTKLAMKHPREVREELELAVRETLESSPRWRSNGGRDHLAVVASGNAVRYLSPELRERAVILCVDKSQTLKLKSLKSARRAVAIPYPIETRLSLGDVKRPVVGGRAAGERRTIDAWFEGRGDHDRMREVSLPAAFRACARNFVQVHTAAADAASTVSATEETAVLGAKDAWLDRLADSTFCLVPQGLTPASRRPFEGLVYGAVPVVFSDNFALPFASWLRYDEFAIRVSASCLDKTPELARGALARRDEAHVARMRAAMADVRSLFLYRTNGPDALDAIFATILAEKTALNLSGLRLPDIDERWRG